MLNNYNDYAQHYVNQLPTKSWLRVRLRGTRSNRDGVGALVRLKLEDGRQQLRHVSAGDGYASQYSRVVHFGLDQGIPAELTIYWPSGISQTVSRPGPDQLLEITEASQ